MRQVFTPSIPAQAGIQSKEAIPEWIPVSTGMTIQNYSAVSLPKWLLL